MWLSSGRVLSLLGWAQQQTACVAERCAHTLTAMATSGTVLKILNTGVPGSASAMISPAAARSIT